MPSEPSDLATKTNLYLNMRRLLMQMRLSHQRSSTIGTPGMCCSIRPQQDAIQWNKSARWFRNGSITSQSGQMPFAAEGLQQLMCF